MRILFLGDIFGKPGRKLLTNYLPNLKEEYKIDFCIANCENLASGRGITQKAIGAMIHCGVDIFTSGNHLWDKKESLDFIKESKIILKPLNVPKGAFGSEYYIFKNKIGAECAVVCLLGQTYMPPCDMPIPVLENLLKNELLGVENVFIDFHAEATGEKKVFALHFDGKVSAIVGTHTHVQTSDQQILKKGTGYITDVGMVGGHYSGIGVKKEIVIEKTILGMPKRYLPSDQGLQINGVVFEIKNGRTYKIERVLKKYENFTKL